MSLFKRIKTRIKNWVNLDYAVPSTHPDPHEPDLHRPASGLCGSPGTVTMPLQPFLDLQFAVQAGTDTDVISKAHNLMRAVEFPETVFGEPTLADAFRERLLTLKQDPDWQGLIVQQAIGVLGKHLDFLARTPESEDTE